MSDEEEDLSPGAIGRLMGKTTTFSAQILFSNPNVEKKSYFVIYGKETEEDGTRPSYILNIVEMWREKKGMFAKLQVLGERPQKPFEMGTEVFLATEEQISKILGIYNPPEKSISLGLNQSHRFPTIKTSLTFEEYSSYQHIIDSANPSRRTISEFI